MALVAPESRSLVKENIRKGTRGEFSAQQYEFTGLTKEGVKIECETFVLFIPYKWGVTIHGTLRNISLQKRIDEELQRPADCPESIPASVFYTDREHRFIRANKAFCKSPGIPLEQIIGKTLTELFPNLPAEQLSDFFAVSDLRETEEKLWYLSFHDVLTGLYNRAYFEEELSRLENGRHFPISVVSVRVDDLLAVNERDGITEGNELLIRAAKVLNIFRADDVVARIGGDRFAAFMPG